MPFNLRLKNYMVFASIFKLNKGERRFIRWRDFTRAMDHVGFDYCKEPGTMRVFKSRSLELKSSLHWREPKDGVLTPRDQKDLAAKMTERLAWKAASFKLQN
ncbi:uncharacterized protein TRAVEDRAFT_52927 [Trametes versicolor FP-101664 SS1]|uniref:uncharacterized protein n=1 Tax=Trametes versicolor (strain FP-101664) TaxID=717944 RepID=UPI0004623C28|nr:uncharacterized protein TRAVEDRAFT_52927 [Trametes versicolor FP-101664 SS1]EIW52484.1 hypothetical protein TRAVEDRAFT_52927 [Trametes versicolor FP-101664 SS1]